MNLLKQITLLIGLILCLPGPQALAQREYYNWYFGRGAGITFNNGPQAIPNGNFEFPYHNASLSDKAGNYLFSTKVNSNGISVIDLLGNKIAGGDSIGGISGRAGDVLVVPQPGAAARYYLFNTQNWNNVVTRPSFNYSVVSYNPTTGVSTVVAKDSVVFLPGGIGGADVAKNQAMTGFAAVRHANGRDIWIIVQNRRRQYVSFLLTPSGLRPTPVVSLVPRPPLGSSVFGDNYSTIAGITSSPSGDKLAVSGLVLQEDYVGTILYRTKLFFNEIAEFAPAQGIVTSSYVVQENFQPVRRLARGSLLGLSGISFSPDGSKLYVDTLQGKEVWQYDLLAGSPVAVGASRNVVARLNSGDGTTYGNRLQLAPDGKIYVLDNNTYAGSIAQPNATGPACGFRDSALYLGPRKYSGYNLPKATNDLNLPPVVVSGPGSISVRPICAGEILQLTSSLSPFITAAAYAWNFGDPASGRLNSASGQAPAHRYLISGTYTVTLIVTAASGQQYTTTQMVQVLPRPVVSLGPDTTLCYGEVLLLSPGTQPAGSTYRWQDGSTTPQLRVERAGSYTVTVTNPNGCSAASDLTVTQTDCAYLPNIITPNGDAQNDYFVLRGLRASDWNIEVYNRWGRRVYQTASYDNSWNADGQSAGVYYYMLHNAQTGQQYKGWVEVVR